METSYNLLISKLKSERDSVQREVIILNTKRDGLNQLINELRIITDELSLTKNNHILDISKLSTSIDTIKKQNEKQLYDFNTNIEKQTLISEELEALINDTTLKLDKYNIELQKAILLNKQYKKDIFEENKKLKKLKNKTNKLDENILKQNNILNNIENNIKLKENNIKLEYENINRVNSILEKKEARLNKTEIRLNNLKVDLLSKK